MQTETQFRDPRSLKPHPDNPRIDIQNDPELIALAENIKSHDILQPIIITADDTILIGHRRTAAAIIAGLETVPVQIRDLSDNEYAADIFLAENVQRQDLSALEEARALQGLREVLEKERQASVPLTDLARRTNIPLNTVSLRLAILELPESVQQMFHRAELPLLSSRELAKLKDHPADCEMFANRLASRVLNLNNLKKAVEKRVSDIDVTREAPKKVHQVQSASVVVTRTAAIENLKKNSRNTISLFMIEKVLETTCCSCGMAGEEAICQQCPLPRFVTGLVGRSDSTDNKEEF